MQNPDAINFFKGALDTSGDGTISYGTSKKLVDDEGNEMPKRFKFTGRVIFISNLPPDKVPQPLKSRGYSVDLSMDKDQTLERLKTIAKDKDGNLKNLKFPGIDDYSHDDMESIVDHLAEVKDRMRADLSVRTIGSLLGIKQLADEDGSDWKKMASHMLFSKGEETSNFYDGSELIKSRQSQILKSYGIATEIQKGGLQSTMEAFDKGMLVSKGHKVTDFNDAVDMGIAKEKENRLQKGGPGSGRHKEGDKVKIAPQSDKFRDIKNRHGQTGTVKHVGFHTNVQFEDGTIGNYQHHELEKV